MNVKHKMYLIVFSLALSACSARSTFQATDGELQVKINDNPSITVTESVTQEYPTTSFGQYKFKVSAEGQEPMYGLLPLKFNGGYLAADIILFAPAMFFNLREVFPYYQFDVAEGVVKYKKKDAKEWITYKPTPAEIQHAKTYFHE
ncbi:hypothetical protein [Neptunicella sp. SCSIO 80796]|uniref:hypothetical protein n=1 Tax=Neptunicella plasticusilytica TaxID=3117012 RepID=UPI003A4D49C3